MSKYVIVDLEMCHVPRAIQDINNYYRGSEIIQIGAVLVDEDLQIVDNFVTLVCPEFGTIDTYIENLTGISRKDVCGAPRIKEALEMFIDWLPEDAILVS